MPRATPPDEPAGWPRAPRQLAAGRGAAWWSEGWRIFKASPVLWIGVIVVMMLVMFVLNVVPFLGGIAAMILWPVFGGGLMLGCHALAQGRPLAFEHLFAAFKDGRAAPLVILGLIGLAAGTLLVLVTTMFGFGVAGLAGASFYAFSDPTTAMGNAWAGAGIATLLIVVLLLIGSTLFWMAWFFATPLIVLNRASPVDALKASFDASFRNLGALAVFGLVFMGLAIVASIPFALGWLVLGPVAVGASYAAWREVFGD